jgi:ribosome-binding factor A
MSERVRKVNQQIKQEVSAYLQANLEVKNGVFTVTAVETTPDLKFAKVWYSYLGGDEQKIETSLRSNKSGAQRHVNSKLTMKYVPRLEFCYDKSGEYAEHISKLLNNS